MIQTIRNAWKIPELRKKILFTIFCLLIFRIGNAIPVPYVDLDMLKQYFASMGNTALGMLNAMSGGALSQATVFALSIQPYINASIIIQLLTVAIPALERLQKDGGEEGKKKLNDITRYSTVAIALLQGFGYYTLISRYSMLSDTSAWAAVVIVVTFVAGSTFLMWVGEQITEFGIGNGISIILFASIVSRLPTMINSLIIGVRNHYSGVELASG
ncbi:MAG TPA: preprotein translocase subunit SecY, partial [Oscillospiraceae bacterium]|nr:preprotein translocase subunit SecY [Oscillospiraceae bacterium]